MQLSLTHHLDGEALKRCDRLLDLLERGFDLFGAERELVIRLDEGARQNLGGLIGLFEKLVGLYARRKQTTPHFTFAGGFPMLFRLPSTFPTTLITLALPTSAQDAEGFPVPVADLGVMLVSNNESAVLVTPTDDALVFAVEIVGPQLDGSPNTAALSIQVFQQPDGPTIGSLDGCVIEVTHGAPASFGGGGADFSAFGQAVDSSPGNPAPPAPAGPAAPTDQPVPDGHIISGGEPEPAPAPAPAADTTTTAPLGEGTE